MERIIAQIEEQNHCSLAYNRMNITKSRSFQNSNRVMETGKKISRGQIQRVKKERIEWDNIGRSNNQKFLHNINPNVSVT